MAFLPSRGHSLIQVLWNWWLLFVAILKSCLHQVCASEQAGVRVCAPVERRLHILARSVEK